MTVLDWIVLLVWAGITLGGFWKGAVRIVFGVGGVLIGVWLAVLLGTELADRWMPWVGSGWLAGVLAHGLLLLGPVVVCLVAAWGVDRTVAALRLGWLNRLAGAAVAGAAAALLLAVVVGAAVRASPVFRELSDRSVVVSRLTAVVRGGTAQPPTAATSEPAAEDGSSAR